ncbi:MAG: MBL fold metallo-hydrolase [Synechococcus sp.]|nr:MBL fold metallo-hydrolase [Synechococcus sp.]
MPAPQLIPARRCALVLLGTTLALGATLPAQAGGVSITSYGHSALLIRGGGQSVLINPFRAVGCAKGLAEPRVAATVILASSELADEGARIASGTFLAKPGSYRVGGLKLEGFAAPHDRIGGRRYGQATLWRWQQGGLSFAHLGGTAAKLGGEDKVLLGRPDVLIIGVGGGGKVYNGQEAAEVIKTLNPRRVIPVQYVTGTAPEGCDQTTIQPFLDALGGISVQRVGSTLNLPAALGDSTVVDVMR